MKIHVPKRNPIVRLVALVAVVAFLAACSKETSLNPLQTVNTKSTVTNNVGLNFCTPPAVQQKMYVKTVIVLDHSGSNAENYKMTTDGTGAPDVSSGTLVVSPEYATDPLGLTRYGTPTTSGTLLNYLSTMPANVASNPTHFFALVDFSNSATTYPVGSQGFTSSISDFYNYVYNDAGTASGGAPNDAGGTSYLTALTAAYNIINNDIVAAKACAALATTATPTTNCPTPGVVAASSYVVVFMSDGSPIINISGVGTNSSGQTVVTGPIVLTKESSTDILGKVNAMISLQTNSQYVSSVNMFTIYYYHAGNIDTSGQSLLKQMADAGGGLAYNALSGTNIDYTQFQPPSSLMRYTLSDVFVTNSSGVWASDGSFLLDSDHDGIADVAETANGLNPNLASSANNGVSDLVRSRLGVGAVNYASGACSSIARTTVAGILTFHASDPDGLNDCEKTLLNNQAGINNPDSNGDNIPDWLEFINGVPFQVGTTPAVNTKNQDGYTTYEKIKYSLPVNIPVNTMINVIPSSYNLIQTSSSNIQTCYHLDVTNLPVVGPTNQVRVDLIMKNNLLTNGTIYKIGHKSFAAGATSLTINDWNDTTEIANKTWSSWP